jgi:hypothetical protein
MKERIDDVIGRRVAATPMSRPTTNPVADWIAGSRIVAYHSRFAEITESVTSALLLSQFWYWSGTPTALEREGWFWMTQSEIRAQTGLTRWEQESARRRLKDLGVLTESRQGIPAKLWFHVEKDRLFDLVLILLESQIEIKEEVKEDILE